MNNLPTLLIVDDDAIFREVLARAMRRRDFVVATADSHAAALLAARVQVPDYAIVDLKMPESSGLSVVPELKLINPAMRILMLTGFASIATAVEAIKLGATQYLAKPADAEEIFLALTRDQQTAEAGNSAQRLSVDRLEWEHIQTVLSDHDGNVSATARALHMHRRTLQRKLAKKPVAK